LLRDTSTEGTPATEEQERNGSFEHTRLRTVHPDSGWGSEQSGDQPRSALLVRGIRPR